MNFLHQIRRSRGGRAGPWLQPPLPLGKFIAERFAASGANRNPCPPPAPNASASCTLRGNSLICGGAVSGFAKLVDVAIRRSGHTAIATSAQPKDSFTPHTDMIALRLHYDCTTHALNFFGFCPRSTHMLYHRPSHEIGPRCWGSQTH